MPTAALGPPTGAEEEGGPAEGRAADAGGLHGAQPAPRARRLANGPRIGRRYVGNRWEIAGFQGSSRDFHGFSIDFHGFSIDFHGFSMDFPL